VSQLKVLYTFYHGSAFGWSLVHKLTMHPNAEVDLLVADGWDWCVGKPKLLLLLRFIDAGVFSKVYTYDNRVGRKAKTLDETEAQICGTFDAHFEKEGVHLESYDAIYSNTDGEDTLGVYFSLKGIKYWWFEAVATGLSIRTRDWVESTYTNMPGYKDALIKHGTLYGENILMQYILNPNSSTHKFPKDRINFFDIDFATSALPAEIKKQILHLFDHENLAEIAGDKTMLMLQSNWLPSLVYNRSEFAQKYFKHHWLYMYFSIQCELDYFLPLNSEPLLKTHPTVPIDEKSANRFFNDAYATNALFSSSLLYMIPSFKVENVVLLSSSANNQVLDFVKNKIIKCPGVLLHPLIYTKFFVVCSLLDNIGALYKDAGERFQPIGPIGIIMDYNNSLLATDINSMIETNFPNTLQKPSTSFIVINEASDDMVIPLNDYDVVIVTDVWESMSVSELIKRGATAFSITKTPVKSKKDILAPLHDEYIYVFSNNQEIKQAVSNWDFSRINSYSGLALSAKVHPSLAEMFELQYSDYIQLENNVRVIDEALHNIKHILNSKIQDSTHVQQCENRRLSVKNKISNFFRRRND